MTIATAESCTGGLIAGALTAIPGSSDAVYGGFVTYANEAKIAMIGVAATADPRATARSPSRSPAPWPRARCDTARHAYRGRRHRHRRPRRRHRRQAGRPGLFRLSPTERGRPRIVEKRFGELGRATQVRAGHGRGDGARRPGRIARPRSAASPSRRTRRSASSTNASMISSCLAAKAGSATAAISGLEILKSMSKRTRVPSPSGSNVHLLSR